MSRWLLMLALPLLVVTAITPLYALSPPSLQQWEQIDSAGQRDQVNANLLRLSKFGSGAGATDEMALGLIARDYGQTGALAAATAASGNADLDGNGIVDERDVLALGFRETDRSPSMILPFGTAAENNQPRLLVFLVKFSDQEPTDMTNQGSSTDDNHDKEWAEDSWFNLSAPGDLKDTSVAYYHNQASYGKLELDGGVFYDEAVCDSEGWITSAYTREQVDGDGTGDTHNPFDVILDVLNQVDPYLDFADYDANHDGFVDGIVTIYAGADDITTNMWHFFWHTTISYYTDDVWVYSGIWTSEEAYIQIWCHETGHTLGLPDLYDVGGSQTGDDLPGIGVWGLMGDWTIGPDGTGVIPALPCAWSRMKLRWVEPVDILTTNVAGSQFVNRATSVYPQDTLFRIARNGWSVQEYFLVEYRDCQNSWDQNLPGDGGLLIWHVDEGRTSRRNHDNAFTPQRVWLECAENAGVPNQSGSPWRSGHNGDDGFDYFGPSTTPNSRGNDNFNTYVLIDPVDSPGGTAMEFTAVNEAGNGLPTLSWNSPDEDETVSGSVAVSVTSTADLRVEYYANGCLKQVEDGPSPYSGFNWNTLSSPDGAVELLAVAYNSTGVDPVRARKRMVVVDNGPGSGAALPWSENFNSYAGAQDGLLLNSWSMHEDRMGMKFQLLSDPAYGGSGSAFGFAQTAFPTPNIENQDDPNAGVYEGQDDDWLMTPRLSLSGLTNLTLEYQASFRQRAWGQGVLVVQATTDDGASWQDLESATYFNFDGEYSTGKWIDGLWAQRSVPLTLDQGGDAYIRFLFVGGMTYNTGFALDEISIGGTNITLDSATPARGSAGTEVTLTGSGFGAPQGNGEVRFSDGAGGYVAQDTTSSWSESEIICLVPAGATTDSSGIWVYQDFAESDSLPFSVPLAAPVLDELDRL